MECERAEKLLPDYLHGNLGAEQEDAIETHLESCAKCREEVALWKKLGELPQEQPSPALRVRVQAMVNAFQQAQAETSQRASESSRMSPGWAGWRWFRSPAMAVSFTLALLVVGFVAGRYTNSGNTSTTRPDAEIAAMQTELSNMRQLVVLSMLQQQSASGRLQGVTWSTQQPQTDPQILSALLHTLRFDSSVDVRLAAIDALSRHGNQPQVREGLADALQMQQSPLVQLALIDLFVDMKDRNVVGQLQKLQQDAGLNPDVRQRAEWALGKLN